VVAYLVRDHVRLREIAGSAEARSELLEEAQIDIDLLVTGAVEPPRRRRLFVASVKSTSVVSR
jgi:hypothetical protein